MKETPTKVLSFLQISVTYRFYLVAPIFVTHTWYFLELAVKLYKFSKEALVNSAKFEDGTDKPA